MVDLVKLHHAVTYTMWKYVKSMPSDRPQRPFVMSDTEALVSLIKDINVAYQVACNQLGSAADFQSCKDAVLEKCDLPEPTRNFYASVLATYFRWRQRKNQSEYEQKMPYLNALAAFTEYATAPKHH